jgi:hypothetical protein
MAVRSYPEVYRTPFFELAPERHLGHLSGQKNVP